MGLAFVEINQSSGCMAGAGGIYTSCAKCELAIDTLNHPSGDDHELFRTELCSDRATNVRDKRNMDECQNRDRQPTWAYGLPLSGRQCRAK